MEPAGQPPRTTVWALDGVVKTRFGDTSGHPTPPVPEPDHYAFSQFTVLAGASQHGVPNGLTTGHPEQQNTPASCTFREQKACG